MKSGVSASASSPIFPSLPSKPKTTHVFSASRLAFPRTLFWSDLKVQGVRFSTTKGLVCRSNSRPGDTGSGDSESRSVLDAFFLGKALAEALNERVESAVGELLSTIGRLQSEQQKQVLDFQEEVLERAKRAKEKAAREALEAQGLTTKPVKANTTPRPNGAPLVSVTSSPTSDDFVPVEQSSTQPDTTDQDPVLGVSDED
ncbi:uncharacterized protein At4g13200, chloroplastic [Ziziphus jujuba]|uniref:Uncharacterized protein At4g13200, chloroplastic n=1 Tax=Ziziphus jujuba TaxID=326968 RepID=A0A6P4B1T1_ZIZJJ|nr:uncharacterized protein At4g13200, chloroplastic [Ziziphus jujuba]